MSLSNISLTAGMRNNLTNLQGTVSLLNRTQERLSTGKKVNSALDDPTSFFTAQSLNNRASDIDSLKNDMGQAISALTAADKGITGITALIQQAKGIAQKAQATAAGGSNLTQTLTVSGVKTGDVVTVGGQNFTAGTTAGFAQGNSDALNAAALMTAINAGGGTVTSSGVNGNVVSLWKTGGTVDMADADVAADPTAVSRLTESGLIAGSGNDLAALQTSYNDVRTQINNMVTDSGYKGTNLLTTSTLNVKFESSSLAVNGFDATSGGLGITAASWAAPGNAAADVTKLDSALSTLQSNSAAMASNLSIITTRQSFSTDMINTLTSGADKLTLADTNEEGANMLMLQTRQSLGTTALSLSSQAAQSVLKLFG